jgi:hypothetical protein
MPEGEWKKNKADCCVVVGKGEDGGAGGDRERTSDGEAALLRQCTATGHMTLSNVRRLKGSKQLE